MLVDRNRRAARRIGDIEGLQEALFTIGSAQNIHLTKLSRGRRVLFLEGQDMRLLTRRAFQAFPGAGGRRRPHSCPDRWLCAAAR
ncbi:hypothetical protein AB5I41_10340 [Sphingomonas sp. MMS24-JH45]